MNVIQGPIDLWQLFAFMGISGTIEEPMRRVLVDGLADKGFCEHTIITAIDFGIKVARLSRRGFGGVNDRESNIGL